MNEHRLFATLPNSIVSMCSDDLRKPSAWLNALVSLRDFPNEQAVYSATQAIRQAFPNLSMREVQVSLMLLHGLRNQDIALALRRSSKTVEYHRTRLSQKLQARSPMHLSWLIASAIFSERVSHVSNH